MSGTDTKKMRSKIFLAVLLLTPILVVTLSTLYFSSGMSPEGTKNNGVFFKSYFDLNDFKNIEGKQDLIKFEDGKWILSVYVTNINSSEESIYLARQLNVALNRDINKLKRVIFTSDENTLAGSLSDYPRVEIVIDSKSKLFKKLLQAGNESFFEEQKIFIIDPYGRAVMFFPVSLDPKLILKDLKVLI